MQIPHSTFEEVTKFFVSTALPQCDYIAVDETEFYSFIFCHHLPRSNVCKGDYSVSL